MKKILSILVIFIFILTGCTQPIPDTTPDNTQTTDNTLTPDNVQTTDNEPDKQTAFELFGKNALEDTLIMLLNNPDSAKLAKVNFNETLMLNQSSSEQILIIPKNANTSIQIWSLRFYNDELVRDNLIYENRRTSKDFVLDTHVIRTEGAPQYKMVVYTPDSFAEYYFSYNGKDGTPEVEFITRKKYSSADNFSFHEMGYMFTNKEDDIISIFGKPSEKRTIPLIGDDTATQMIYGETVFEIDNFNGKVYSAIIHDNKIVHPRGVKVGDDIQSVLSKFPNRGSSEKIKLDGDRSYSLLYGEYKHMQDFGIIEYVSDDPVTITYSQESSNVVFEISNGKVSKVRYEIPLT